MFDFNNDSHRRYNPLTDSWVLVSPHRTQRPWQGQEETAARNDLPEYVKSCYLCPGNKRASGAKNEKYTTTFIFENDYAAVKPDQELLDVQALEETEKDERRKRLFKVQGVRGNCYVICFSPKHNISFPLMSIDEIAKVVDTWTELYRSTKRDKVGRYLLIFENKGAAMGCSNPHPHSQAWCTESLPTELFREFRSMQKYSKDYPDSHILLDYLAVELEDGSRIIDSNNSFTSLVPYWAIWPFEVMIIAKRRIPALIDLTSDEKKDLADIISKTTIRYDNLFETSFPYSMGIHQAPIDPTEAELNTAHLHLHFYPPLLRGATVKKFLVGYEMLGEPQRDLTPEQAADRLRALSLVSYTLKQ
ncbi:galactose-1-phosphate uridyl transferase [Dipodascopsis uninucleata]